VKVALLVVISPAGPLLIAVSGGVLSTITTRWAVPVLVA